MKTLQEEENSQLLKLSDYASDVLSKINGINNITLEIIRMWLEIVNVIDFAVSWRYLVDCGFYTVQFIEYKLLNSFDLNKDQMQPR